MFEIKSHNGNRFNSGNKIMNDKKVLLFAGSNSPDSINRKVIEYVAGKLKNSTTNILDLRNYPLPIFSVEIEMNNGIPENANALQKIFQGHDAFVVSVAEHNGSITAFLKNTLDWLSRTQKNYKILANKPILLLSASVAPGGRDALSHAEVVMKRLGGKITGKVTIPKFHENVKVDDNVIEIVNDGLKNQIKEAVDLFEKELTNKEEFISSN